MNRWGDCALMNPWPTKEICYQISVLLINPELNMLKPEYHCIKNLELTIHPDFVYRPFVFQPFRAPLPFLIIQFHLHFLVPPSTLP